MLASMLPHLRCPNCLEGNSGALAAERVKKVGPDIRSGELRCRDCDSLYPVLAGVAVLVSDVESYLRRHARGISAFVAEDSVPERLREALAQGIAEADPSEEDLESERVNALYFLTHYVRVRKANPWWRPARKFSPEINRLVKGCWNRGPFSKVARWARPASGQSVIELGCGVGGLAQVLAPRIGFYLGVDTSFTSVALARHANLGAPYALSTRIPQDLYAGPLTKKMAAPKPLRGGKADFVVSELENLPVAREQFDLAVALNVIDVIEDPRALPRLQRELLKNGGTAIHGSPYLWEPTVAEELRASLPGKLGSSSEAITYLYKQEGFRIEKNAEHVPWLFLEHFRKIGLYSVHMLAARKQGEQP